MKQLIEESTHEGSDSATNQIRNCGQNQQLKSKKTDIFSSIWCIIIFFGLIFVGICAFVVYKNSTREIKVTKESEVYDHIKLNSASARCLDGSPASYLLSRSGNPQKMLVYFIGGGWCGQANDQKTLQSCYQRSKTELGSSNYVEETKTFSSGIFGNHQDNNFKDWKRAYFYYCDGAGHQGTREDPVEYKGTKLYFRGYNNTVEKLEDLEKKFGLFSKARQVVISGDSAGGLASYMWANYIAERIKKGRVSLVSDSAIFYDTQNTQTKVNSFKLYFNNVLKLSQADVGLLIPECIRDFPDSRQNCLFAQNIWKYVKVPMFVSQSMYDRWMIPNILGINCANQKKPNTRLNECTQQEVKVIEQYRQNVTSVMKEIAQKKGNGAWGVGCFIHSFLPYAQYESQNFTVPQNSVYTLSDSIKDWYTKKNTQNVHIDMDQWPANKPCASHWSYA